MSVCGLFWFVLLLYKDTYMLHNHAVSVVANILQIFHNINLTLLGHHTMFGYNYWFLKTCPSYTWVENSTELKKSFIF